MKKLLISVLVIIISCGTLVLTSCWSEEHNHSYPAEWSIVIGSTCEEEGKRQRKCLLCEEIETESTPARGHNYVNGICLDCGKKE